MAYGCYYFRHPARIVCCRLGSRLVGLMVSVQALGKRGSLRRIQILKPKVMPHLNIWEYFAGVGLLIAGFLYLLVRKARKESRTPIKSIKRKRPDWDGLYAVNTEDDLDEYEQRLGGDKTHCN